MQVDAVVYLVDAYDKERLAEAKKELDALHKKEQHSTILNLVNTRCSFFLKLMLIMLNFCWNELFFIFWGLE